MSGNEIPDNPMMGGYKDYSVFAAMADKQRNEDNTENLKARIKELEGKTRCPVNAMQCEYARILVECAAPELDCPHRKPPEE